LPDASVDAVVISAAWHWLDPDRAVPEITRVLRVGGVLGVLWVARDVRVPWVAELSQVARQAPGADGQRGGRPGGRRRREVAFPPGTPLSPVAQHTVEYSRPMTKDDLLGMLGTYSGVITLEPGLRASLIRRVQDWLGRQPWEQADLPLICRCLRSSRLPG
jgi:SAM-dependent methyltransferase